MGEDNKGIVYNPSGSSRNRRFLPMLDPGYFKIDDRSLADFLVFTEKYADLVYAHRTSEDAEDTSTYGSWKNFFDSDISVFLARIASINLDTLLPFYLREEKGTGFEVQKKLMQAKLAAIANFVSFITESYHHLINRHGDDPTVKQLVNSIEEIRRSGLLADMVRLMPVIDREIHTQSFQHKHFEFIWGTPAIIPTNTSDKTPEGKKLENLARAMNQFLAAAAQIVYYARSLFQDSITNNQYHTPGTALFIAFLKLYQYVQQDLNAITGKHLDFFYRELLQQKMKPSEPDHAHVCFTLADHADSSLIEKGTLFKAGIDEEGYDRLYTATDFLKVNKTQITDLCSIYLEQHNEVGLENSYEYISNIYQSEILTSKGGFDFSLAPLSFAAVEKTKETPENKIIKVSEVGFAIASPLLMMSEGKRECDLVLSFNLRSMSSLLSFLERFTVNENSTFDRIFHKLFSHAFKLSLTTADGWYEIIDYKLYSPDSISGSFRISFVLPMGAPSITGMGEKWDKNEAALYNTGWPVLKLCLTNEKSMLMYSYLKDLVISECSIQVSVSGIKNLEVFNDLGQLDTSNPFYPFGSIPVLGSSLLIGNAELYNKNIDDFSVELGWYNLPRTKGGFKQYYQEYDPKIDNDSFRVGATALSDFEFHPTAKEKVQQFSLFSIEEEMEGQLPTLSQVTVLKGFDINLLRINADYSKTALPPYSNKAKSGYIKLELLSPEMCFGQAIYPTLFSSKLIKGMKSANVELPNPPYVPQLKSITLNYQASTRISFESGSLVKSDPKADEKVFLLQPFGIQTIFKNSTSFSDNFLPRYQHNGYLMIGLDNVQPSEPLTIHFVLEPSLGNEFEAELPVIEWYYVYQDRWISFDKKDLVFDTTRSFTATGIVKLSMPKLIDNQNTALPSGKYWIVAAIKGDLKLVAKLKGIYTQALKLEWTPQKKGAFWTGPIPANTIDSFLNARAEIAAVFQPLPSFGGRDKEKPQEYYTRVSERLQHRNRCVTAWDYERMVLEKFPFVNQVKCISPVDNHEFVEQGKIILVVVPAPAGNNEFVFPRFNYSILQEIKEYIEGYISPFVSVQVINPVYEEVKVSASVRFRDMAKKGTGIEDLHRDLRDFICPWYNDRSQEILFGGSVNLDELEAFLRNRSYIGYVTNVSMLILHYYDKYYSISDSVVASLEDKTLYASKPWAVLIPMKQHPIKLLETDEYISPGQAAVENLRLGNEFVVVDPKKEDKPIPKPGRGLFASGGNFITVEIELD